MNRLAILLCSVLLPLLLLSGCGTVRTLDAGKPGAPIVYSGTRLDWYSLNGGCCPVDRFGAEAPRYAALDLPASLLLDTLLLPFSLAAVLGVGLNVQGGL
ncbi:YceK/YidQ family lipoprotein [Stutzerimonas zhaodongensis]|uniref:YceK/YidQ family lipoprotein n=1 Tax=Stutzerimonas zhaodongensis TaxID=1176257 RepID=UPI0039F13058